MTYSLATVRTTSDTAAVIEVGGGYYRLSDISPELLQPSPSRGLINVFEQWEEREPVCAELADAISRRAAGASRIDPAPKADDFLTPLQYPSKVVLTGANYYEHLYKDAGMLDFRKEDKIPTFFLKPPTTTLVGSGKSVRYPTQSKQFDWEIELAVIVGKRMRRVSAAHAMRYVAGYTIGLDLSARDWQLHPKHLVKFDLFGGKAFDDSCPLGPRITPARYVQHDNLDLKLWVNDVLKQNANSRDMIWSLPEQLAAMSEHVTLEPGDVILTGTPAGVGWATGQYLKVGDRIDAEISGLGRLSVEIIADGG